MKFPFVFMMLILLSLNARGQQNLVSNPSFEDLEECPNNSSDWNIIDWSKPNGKSSDNFNTCASPSANYSASVPMNIMGFQEPSEGSGYVGIAKLCPLDHGFGVYTARAALLKLDTLPAHYFAECERVPSPEQISEKKLEEKEGDGQFRVYPNPSDGTFDLNYALNEQETGVVEIYSAMGQLVYTLPLQPGAQSSRMTMEHVANGIYHLRVTVNGESRMTTKLIIQN